VSPGCPTGIPPTAVSTFRSDERNERREEYEIVPQQQTMTILKQPEWVDAQVETVDVKYFTFFVRNMHKCLIYTSLFPNAVNEIFARSTQSKPLKHAVLSISSLLADYVVNRPFTRALVHKQEAMASVQQCLSSGEITEDLAIAVFLLLLLDCFIGKEAARAHLQGLNSILKVLNLDTSNINPLSWNNISPVLLLIWRNAMRVDAMLATIREEVPIFPQFPAEFNSLQRSWAVTLAKDGRSADLGMASFALDNFYQRANHLLRKGIDIRNSDEYLDNPETREAYEALIRERVTLLRQEHAAWLEQPAIAFGVQLELMAQQGDVPANTPRFLDYPPLIIQDKKFCLLLNEWRALYLYITIIAIPNRLRRHTMEEVTHAIEICRTHAALTLPPLSWEMRSEFFAALTVAYVFAGGKNYHRELDWVHDRLAKIEKLKYPILTSFQALFLNVQNFREGWDEWDLDVEGNLTPGTVY
jgi:Fungal specific transcription factor domain